MKPLMLTALAALQIAWSQPAFSLAMTCAQAESQEIKSLKGDVPVSVLFENRRSTKVDVMWVTYERTGKLYKTLEPGQSYTQQTFMTHPWAFFESGTANCLGIYLPDSAQNTHVIK